MNSLFTMFEGMPLFTRIAGIHAVIVAISQLFVFPLIAFAIKKRFTSIGRDMRANPLFSSFRGTRFWSEARELNNVCDDERVNKYLSWHKVYWIYLIASFAFWMIGVFFIGTR